MGLLYLFTGPHIYRSALLLSYQTGSDQFADSFNTLRTGSFKLFKRPFPGFLTILTL